MKNNNPQLFGSLFLQQIRTFDVPPHYYDPNVKMVVDAETKVPLWLGESTNCTQSSGMKNSWADYCTGHNADGECTGTVYKMDFYSDYDQVVDAL